MDFYKLKAKIENPAAISEETAGISFDKIDATLKIESHYFIYRIVDGDRLLYVHERNNEVFKVCLYEKTEEDWK